MKKKLALIHTVTSLVQPFKELCDELLPEVEVFNIVDESLLKITIAEGSMSHTTARRLIQYMFSAEQAGADVIMVTCSSVGEAVHIGRPLFTIPVVRVDRPMIEYAVETGKKIAVLATLKSTLDPTSALVEKVAAEKKKGIEITSRVCEGAFDAVISGDVETHDEIVKSELQKVLKESDVIVLAQASMARVAGKIGDSDRKIPILSSPRPAVQHLAKNVLWS